MERSLIVLMCLLPLANGQCAAEDDPLCVYWVANGFCSSWGFPQSMIQQYCPKSCPESGCTCPGGSTLVGPAYNNSCSSGILRGSVCCQSVVSCSPSLSIGPCNEDKSCYGDGYACDTDGNYCCPSSSTTTTPPNLVENVNCATWNQDPTIAFCASQTPDQKKLFCPQTCAAEISQVDDCAAYVDRTGMVVRTAMNRTTSASGVITIGNGTDKLLYVSVKANCSITLYAAGSPNSPPLHTFYGSGIPGFSTFYPIQTSNEQNAQSIKCMC